MKTINKKRYSLQTISSFVYMPIEKQNITYSYHTFGINNINALYIIS